MLTTQQLPAEPDLMRTMTSCPLLPVLDTSNLRLVQEVFQPLPRHALGQAWLAKEESGFAPAFVRIGWRGDSLLVFAELTDADIFNFATAHNQRAWELGDTFEIFLKPAGHPAYFEFQVTPNNQRVQLRFANLDALENLRKKGPIESVLMPGEIFHSRTWIPPHAKCWYVYAEINAANLDNHTGSLQGKRWHFSFSRYDYTSWRKKPVISSTTPHAKPDFHCQQEWGMMTFDVLTPPSHP